MPREDTPKAEPELGSYIEHVLIKCPADEIGISSVALTTMDEEQRLELFKLSK